MKVGSLDAPTGHDEDGGEIERLGTSAPRRLRSSSAIALAKSGSSSMCVATNCMCSERRKAAGSRSSTTIRASGRSSAISRAATCERTTCGEASPATWSRGASANSAR